MRTPMVTRTIEGTEVKALCLNVQTQVAEEQTFTISGNTSKPVDDSKLLKKLQKLFDTDDLKVVHINSVSKFKTIYGLTEDEFLQKAVILDPETRKPLSDVAKQK